MVIANVKLYLQNLFNALDVINTYYCFAVSYFHPKNARLLMHLIFRDTVYGSIHNDDFSLLTLTDSMQFLVVDITFNAHLLLDPSRIIRTTSLVSSLY
jgi:hypothetical protein